MLSWLCGNGGIMIKFNLAIRNPFRKEDFKNLWFKSGRLSRHKFWELHLTKYSFYLAEVSIDINFVGQDHAGPKIEIGLFGYNFSANIYDNRHWNYDDWRWV